MAIVFKPRRRTSSEAAPTTANLADGELAVNTVSRKIYMRVGSSIIELFKTLTKSDVGLGNVDNTSDLNKPVSTATQTALNAKQNNLGFTPVQQGTGIGQLSNIVAIGWSGSNLKVTIDNVADQGNLAFQGWVTSNFNPAGGTGIYSSIGPSHGNQGFQTVWNDIENGNGRTEFVNNHGLGTGGYSFFERSATGQTPWRTFHIGRMGELWARTDLGQDVRHVRTFVQSNDPGNNAIDGDLWIW